MIRIELFKLRHHRTPTVLAGTLTAAVVSAPIYYAVQPPTEGTAIIDAVTGIFGVTSLLAAVFGGWMIGHEFRQGTLRRVLGSDARRTRLIATKAGVGLGALVATMAVTAGIGALASLASAATSDTTLAWNGVLRTLVAVGFVATVVAALSFGLSILLRSDTYAMLGSLAIMVIVGPILMAIPVIGTYTPLPLTSDVANWIGQLEEPVVPIVPASLVLTATIGALMAVSTVSFQRRDV